MEAFIERLLNEEHTLNLRIMKLEAFLLKIANKEVSIDEEQDSLLRTQLFFMLKYQEVLKKRIELLNGDKNEK